ncbi:MAG: hypothetical protein IKX23_09485 [Treponema sp.]|nr:hypothetical protein [Treponema sp.]
MKKTFRIMITGLIAFLFLSCPGIGYYPPGSRIHIESEISDETVKAGDEINIKVKLSDGPVNVFYYNLPTGYQYIDCKRENEFVLTEDKKDYYGIPRGYENTTLTILRGYDDAKDYKTEVSFSYQEPGEYKILIECLLFYREYIITVTE